MSTKQDGDWGEALVEKYLSERGCRIVEREWRCRFGEIDLIAEKDGVLLFVEVKLRTNLQYGAPREYVTVKKQEKLRAAALLYLSERELDVPARFDVAEVYTDVHRSAGKTRIRYIANAFCSDFGREAPDGIIRDRRPALIARHEQAHGRVRPQVGKLCGAHSGKFLEAQR